MVRHIRLRGHLIRLCGVTPSTSRSRPQYCPQCGAHYNDKDNRKSIFLCCGFINCLDCSFKGNGRFYCATFLEKGGRMPKKYLESELIIRNWELEEDGGTSAGEGENLEKMSAGATTKQEHVADKIIRDDGDGVVGKVEEKEEERFSCPKLINQIKVEPPEEFSEKEMPKLDAEVPVQATDFSKLELAKEVEIVNCKIKVERWIPKRHWNPVVLLGTVVCETKLKKRKYTKRFQGIATRRSERETKCRNLFFF